MAAAGESGENANGTSAKQIEANRRNASHSTGPRTPEGKAVSKFNAAKHWLRASEIVIPGVEDPRELEAFFQELMQDWMPVGATEVELVRKLAIAFWQDRRVDRAEQAKIRERIEAATAVNFVQQIADNNPGTRLSERSSEAIEQLQFAVESAIGELESGEISLKTCRSLDSLFGENNVEYNPAPLIKAWVFDKMPESHRRIVPDGITKGVDKKAAARQHLEESCNQLESLRRKARRGEKLVAKSRVQCLSIPEGSVAEHILRYRTSCERRIQRLIDQLERLQRRRRGEPPTPTLHVQLKNDDSD